MIDRGRTPVGAIAHVYWPQVAARLCPKYPLGWLEKQLRPANDIDAEFLDRVEVLQNLREMGGTTYAQGFLLHCLKHPQHVLHEPSGCLIRSLHFSGALPDRQAVYLRQEPSGNAAGRLNRRWPLLHSGATDVD